MRRRRRLGHRPQLHRLRAALQRHDQRALRGTPDFPNQARWWEIVERYGVTILYTAPTAIRAHMKWGPEHAQKHDLSSLRLLGSVGEPINPEAWVWYREHIGGDRTPVVDTWWQTETGSILITPLPGITTLKPGSADAALPRRRRTVYDEQERGAARRRGLPGRQGFVAGDAARDLAGQRPRPLTSRRTGRASTASTSRATGRRSTRTATSGWRAYRVDDDERLRPPDPDEIEVESAHRPS